MTNPKQDRAPGWTWTIFIDRLVFLGSSFPHGSQNVAQLFPLSLGSDVSANLQKKRQREVSLTGKEWNLKVNTVPYFHQ